jgi:hypothetical protein
VPPLSTNFRRDNALKFIFLIIIYIYIYTLKCILFDVTIKIIIRLKINSNFFLTHQIKCMYYFSFENGVVHLPLSSNKIGFRSFTISSLERRKPKKFRGQEKKPLVQVGTYWVCCSDKAPLIDPLPKRRQKSKKNLTPIIFFLIFFFLILLIKNKKDPKGELFFFF